MSDSAASGTVAVIGAGAIGAAVAWRCAQRGLTVTLVDPAADRGAWNTAAGMLAPVTELHYTEPALLELGLDSLARYPEFVAELEAESGRPTGFVECGTVLVAWDAADLAALRDLHAFAIRLGVDASLASSRELRALEPALAPGLPGALVAPGDHQIDPRLLHAALLEALRRRGAAIVTSRATVRVEQGRAIGVDLDDGTTLRTDHVVVAAGAWSGAIPGIPDEYRPPVRPVKGQTLHLRLDGEVRLRHVLRATVKGTPVYVVPRADGELVIGASSEEAGFDRQPRAGAVYELLRDAQSVLPELSEAVLLDVSTGLRPGSPDNAPLVGPSGLPGLVHVTGHFRNGILHTPVTADAVADLLSTGTLPDVMADFAPARFATVCS
ncbi:MAG TPA: glycine oxidase ThiO [Jatrophihabitans sp.]|jgi:glycine oxidase|uniref:glycine oxidase ThiO n=1 Tax=Jatrophihabitans sp. TaxID=1932789 RepID=UPI002DF8642F|nr:glycine oxidase ThiO [Jatrophihabitans sp.]